MMALQGSSCSPARHAPAAFHPQIQREGSNGSGCPQFTQEPEKNYTPPLPHCVRDVFTSTNTFFSAKGEDFIKLKVEGCSRAAAAATLGQGGWLRWVQ